ncbi:MAG: hypothetical protein GXY19_09730 [Phycisphaerae bacterium]|nr:hypothetical protein [Phycisphaerae bacterium]
MEHDKPPSADIRRPWRRRIGLAVIVIATVALGVNALLPTWQKELAAIDAKRAVADEDNAALIYAELLQGEEVPPTPSKLDAVLVPIMEATTDPVSLHEYGMNDRRLVELELPKGLLDPNDEEITLWMPWTSAKHPELRQWLDTHRHRIDRLMDATAKSTCCFPLAPKAGRMGLFDVPLGAIRQYAHLLRRDANNDMAEGRIADGLAKYEAIVSTGRHFQAQPAAYLVLTGIGCEAIGLHHLIEFVVTGPATEQDLDTLIIANNDLADRWKSFRRDISRVRGIFARGLEDRRRPDFRLYQWYRSVRYGEDGWHADRVGELYHRVLCEKRAVDILIELRRFKNRTGRWPDQFDEVASCVDPLVLIDPQNGGPYVYQRIEEGFRLYSTGPNGKDENGEHTWNGPDDWPIWPRRGEPRLSKPEDVNDV